MSLQRRTLLRGMLAGGTAVATAPLLNPAQATAGRPTQTAPEVDVSHATRELGGLLTAYFRDKSAADVDATMAHFARHPFAYLDATLGVSLPAWEALRDVFRQVMPTWTSQVRSYPIRIVGDATSAVVFFVNTPGAFGPKEIRAAATVNFHRGRIVRWVDFWDGRHFGLANLSGAQLPQDQFPTDWRESVAGEVSSPIIRGVVRRLNDALAAGTPDEAVALFAPDAVFEDESAHLRLVGTAAIGGFLRRIEHGLPYIGATVRHSVGSASGGGYEWSSTGPVSRGLTALELGPDRRITRLTAVWDGSLVDEAYLTAIQAAAIEH
jgi:hypothetical protein